MSLALSRIRKCLEEFDFQGLFLDGLGWDAFDSTIPLKVGDQTITLQAIAEERGMTVYLCPMLRHFDSGQGYAGHGGHEG